jgi:hypothetical protein
LEQDPFVYNKFGHKKVFIQKGKKW